MVVTVAAKSIALEKVWEKEYVTIRHNPEENFIWNEWRGVIPSKELREAMIYACNFILDNQVELILADYTRMAAPTMDDQVWIANHTAELLQHSKLRRVANLMAPDIVQQVAIKSIYDIASEFSLPCESKDFDDKLEALEWLFSK
ncbi:hypothetical protein H8S95_06515 [Pontibacter sp. KCTC 32443]|uniref:hypothetical protein n=1 Tax=Pontibacter TaxID=323449 RepID=UPI00164D565E|nr:MULTISPECIES: hypothetical protein [Pontibacter]MBC5773709.1 hypothetical protein [Pontibacter sp. KCTC 32443]